MHVAVKALVPIRMSGFNKPGLDRYRPALSRGQRFCSDDLRQKTLVF
jgi:hypothetical protein